MEDRAAVKVSSKEGESIRAAPGGSWKRAGGEVAIRFLPPRAPVPSDQGVPVERRVEDGVLLPHLHQIDHILSYGRAGGFRRFALACFGRHGGSRSGVRR